MSQYSKDLIYVFDEIVLEKLRIKNLEVLSILKLRQITHFNFTHFRCGDRLLAVDGQTLENIPHHLAVKMLKQTSTRVVLEVVSWMGTEL